MANLNQIKLTPNEILKKQFRSKMKGYDQDEVDRYLDDIISDYEVFAKIIEGLQSQISDLKEELAQAQQINANATVESQEVEDVKTYHPTSTSNPFSQTNSSDFSESENNSTTTNVSMLQRISTLERKVYNLEQRMNAQDRTYQAN